MSEPQVAEAPGLMYSYGDLNLCYSLESRNGGEYGSVWAWEPTTDTMPYLADHPGVPSYFDQNEGYYFKDGTFYRYDCATLTEEALIETELEGKYAVCVFPDCIVVGQHDLSGITDYNLYFYNWAFELVDTIKLSTDSTTPPIIRVIAETAGRIFITNTTDYSPNSYIEKSELGTGKAIVHTLAYN